MPSEEGGCAKTVRILTFRRKKLSILAKGRARRGKREAKVFLILLRYVQPLEEIDRWMGEHVRYLRRYYKSKDFIVSGRQVPRTGGVILARARDRATLDRIIAKDPFHREKLAEFQVIEFKASMFHPDFKPFTEPVD